MADLLIAPVAERAWLVSPDLPEAPAGACVRSLRRRLLADPVPGLRDAVPAARTLLVLGGADLDPDLLQTRLRALGAEDPGAGVDEGPLHEIAFRPDGPDLSGVAARLGLSDESFLARLGALELTVGFLGFAPGFPYLLGLPEAWHLPRRASPRPAVPAGSVALAGPYAGIYPAVTPGGWHLVGTTDAVLFDPARVPPCLLSPGDRVRLVPV